MTTATQSPLYTALEFPREGMEPTSVFMLTPTWLQTLTNAGIQLDGHGGGLFVLLEDIDQVVFVIAAPAYAAGKAAIECRFNTSGAGTTVGMAAYLPRRSGGDMVFHGCVDGAGEVGQRVLQTAVSQGTLPLVVVHPVSGQVINQTLFPFPEDLRTEARELLLAGGDSPQEMTHAQFLKAGKALHETFSNYSPFGSPMGNVQGEIRHHGLKVGRNEPCPCGSGSKYKKCCGSVG